MSDLISRSEYKSKLVKALDVLNKEYREALLNEDNDLILAIQNQQSAYMIALRLLDNEPTAYDIDKVVEEIKTLKEEALGEYNMGEYNLDNNIGNSISENYRKDMNEGRCFAYDEAIEIVKQGEIK